MKQLTIFLLTLLIVATAQAQNNYTEAIHQGDAALRRGQYKTAINKYFAAEAFDPSKKAVVQGKVNGVFDKIEALREAQDALGQVKEEQGKTKAALAETEKARLQADSALAKANKLVNAFYFYKDRFALAYKDNEYYFIDKNGDPVRRLGG
ncbi:MAG: hypothetical protein IPM36_17485 [Lewinellaceae bacterium]|nr:hypothetical protein [Lewinellaceae bacterium]